jgi:hypothetical protein
LWRFLFFGGITLLIITVATMQCNTFNQKSFRKFP